MNAGYGFGTMPSSVARSASAFALDARCPAATEGAGAAPLATSLPADASNA